MTEAEAVAEALELAKRLQHAGPGDILIFAPEILKPGFYYGRMFRGPDGQLRKECDRYQQALVYARIARECRAQA